MTPQCPERPDAVTKLIARELILAEPLVFGCGVGATKTAKHGYTRTAHPSVQLRIGISDSNAVRLLVGDFPSSN